MTDKEREEQTEGVMGIVSGCARTGGTHAHTRSRCGRRSVERGLTRALRGQQSADLRTPVASAASLKRTQKVILETEQKCTLSPSQSRSPSPRRR